MFCNKKVLLRQRKRHTVRRVASTRYAGGGVPHPAMTGVPHRVMVGGTPSNNEGGYPRYLAGRIPWVPPTIQTWPWGYPRYPIQTWYGVPPTIRPGMGYPLPSELGWGTPSPSDLGWENPPPHHQTWDGLPPLPSDLRWGTPPPSDLGQGTPSPPPMVNRQTFPSINITFPRTTYAGGNKIYDFNNNDNFDGLIDFLAILTTFAVRDFPCDGKFAPRRHCAFEMLNRLVHKFTSSIV